jgi:hypothetical protein
MFKYPLFTGRCWCTLSKTEEQETKWRESTHPRSSLAPLHVQQHLSLCGVAGICSWGLEDLGVQVRGRCWSLLCQCRTFTIMAEG